MAAIREASFAPATAKGVRTRARILDTARIVFARDGFVEAKMSDIAAGSQLSVGGLYRYFTDKENVFSALIADLIAQLYDASGHTTHHFATDPYEALFEANLGYLRVYHANRVAVDPRFREMFWRARRRHVMRFAKAARGVHGRRTIDGVEIETVVEAMACMVEQSAYLWWAQGALAEREVSVEEAAQVVTRAWHLSIFGGEIRAG